VVTVELAVSLVGFSSTDLELNYDASGLVLCVLRCQKVMAWVGRLYCMFSSCSHIKYDSILLTVAFLERVENHS
jgi:hypothetical protein